MTQWLIDPAHSEVKFKVKHLVISTVTGQFRQFSGSVISEKPDFSDAQISFTADVNSISTNNDQRDGHLKSPDFFDAASYPSLTFTSTSITQVADREYAMHGTMTIRGVAKEVK